MKKPTDRDAPQSPDKVRAIHEHYEHRITPDRENHDVLDWASAESQIERFRVLADNVALAGKSLLDVGCGLGDLLGYLRGRGVDTDYTGVDLVARMVAAAAKLHPTATFKRADVFAENTFEPEAFDVVFCSGIFNLNLGNNHEFLAAALPRLLELSREYVVINLLHDRATFGVQDEYFHFAPRDVLKILRPLPCRARIVDDYLPNDFTVICRKL